MDFSEKLKNKKLKLKSDYLRAELEEVNYEFQNCLLEFQRDFQEHLEKFKTKKKVERVDSEIEFDIPKEKVNKVFKKIATKTHPDKLINENDDSDRLVELYKEAQQSVERNDWSRVTQIADELDIDITDVEEDDSQYLEESIKSMEKKIKDIKKTFAWMWNHSEEAEKPHLKKSILKFMEVERKSK